MRARRRPGTVTLDGKPFAYADAASFLSAYEEIFADQIYRFESQSKSPIIFDLGANVGVGVLYFKKHYPDARVIAFEPDPSIFAVLSRNVATYGFQGVELHNEAVWSENSSLTFAPDGADAGQIRAHSPEGILVKARSIRDVLNVPHVDFLKIDIEGAENVVLPACADMLDRVDNIFVEYHSPKGEPQRLNKIIDALTAAGFRITISGAGIGAPLSRQMSSSDAFDLQLNIFGKRI